FLFFFYCHGAHLFFPSFPTRRSSDLFEDVSVAFVPGWRYGLTGPNGCGKSTFMKILSGEMDPQKGSVARPRRMGVLSQDQFAFRSEEHTSELQSRENLVCRLLLEKKK